MRTIVRLFRNIVSLLLCTVLLFITVLVYNNNQNNSQISANTRTIELKETINDYQSVLNEFDNSTLTTKGATTYFEGYKSLDINTSEIDYISEDDLEEIEQSTIKYNLSYDYEENIVTISALITMQDGSIEVEEIRGVGFINEDNEIDAVMNIDGEGILLSEMRDSGIIDNCGLFSRLVKKVVKAVISVAVTAVVVTTSVAICVATAGIASTALIAVGVGTMTATTVSVATGLTVGTIFYSKIGQSAIKAGTAVAEKIGDGTELIIETSTNIILSFMIENIEYAATKVTSKIKDIRCGQYRFIAFRDKSAYITNMIFDELHAVWGLKLGLSTYSTENDACLVAREASNSGAIRYHGLPAKEKFSQYRKGIYFAHYHTKENSVSYNELGYEIKAGHACFGDFVIVD